MAYTPKSDREVKDGKAMVSAKELADFKSQYGEDKSLRDLLNADKGLRRRGEDSAPAKKADPVKEAAPVKEADPVKETAPAKEAAPAKTESKSGGIGPYNVGAGFGDYLNKTFTMEGREQAKKENKEKFSMKKGGSVSASSRGDGIAQRGKTRGKMC